MPKDQQNGIITGYTVQVTGPNFIREISIADTSTEVSGLRPNTFYNFSVSAMTVAGTGPPTKRFFTTPEGGKDYELPIPNSMLYCRAAPLQKSLSCSNLNNQNQTVDDDNYNTVYI